MPTPREQSGRLNEASRLLQEGLQLLDERSREVDALLQDAREEARRLTYDAQQQAEEITAEAERHRSELEEQVAVLRTEIAEVREELAQLRDAQAQRGGRGAVRSGAVAGAVAAGAIAAGATASSASQQVTDAPPIATEVDPTEPGVGVVPAPDDPVAAAGRAPAIEVDTVGGPRWGRPSSITAAQQALRGRSSRPRWLPRWLPFVILLLAGAGVVTASVGGQSPGRGTNGEQTVQAVVAVTMSPTATSAPNGSGLSVAAATSIATSLVAVASGSLGQSTAPATPSRPPTLAPTRTTPTSVGSPTPTPRLQQTVASTRLPAAAPPPAPVTPPGSAPSTDVGPDGPIVAAYTAYTVYSVRPGDTLNRVATEFGVTGDSIIHASGLADPNLLVPGQVLTIPRDSGWLYRVQPGETLDTVALRFGISATELLAASPLTPPTVRPGDLVFIPNRALPGTKQ